MKKLLIAFFVVIIVALFTATRKMNLISRLDAISSNPNPLIRHFAPTWRSIKKIIDIPLFAFGVFGNDNLPIYEINLSGNDRFNLLNNLPDYPAENRLYESFKTPVKAEFRHGDYVTAEARIRYRGVSPNHWNALKKSFQVNLPEDQPLGERATLRFFIGEDKGWVKGLLWNHLGDKLNILTPKAQAVKLLMNKKNMGVYMLMEGWEESFLERNGRTLGHIFSNKNTDVRDADFLIPDSIPQWYDRNEPERAGETFPELVYFLTLIANAPDEVFEKEIEHILDIDQFLRWTLATMLSGNFHQGNKANLNFYFNPATGKFEVIFFDASPTKIGDAVDLANHRLVNRLLKSDQFKTRFETITRAYVADEKNLEDDLMFYDAMAATMLPAIFRDTAKLPTSWEAWRAIKRDRAFYQHNFLTLKSMLEKNDRVVLAFADEIYPLSPQTSNESSQSFRAISTSRNEFLLRNAQFTAGQNPDTVILLPGVHVFSQTVIVPKNLRFIMREDAELYFAPDVSLISYSPIEARGNAANPILMRPLIKNKSWGVFALINTDEKNVFRHTRIQGGKDATINGVYFSGMLSAHNADLEFRYGVIENAGADDGIRVLSGEAIITDTLFRNNGSDGIDIDFAKGESLFEKNLFVATGGDAMDLSFSKITARENIVRECGDKGISVGEASTPIIQNNTIQNCVYGIAVKDRSEAIITKNIFENNETAIGLYRKKPHFIEGGKATLSANEFMGNSVDTTADEYSQFTEHKTSS